MSQNTETRAVRLNAKVTPLEDYRWATEKEQEEIPSPIANWGDAEFRVGPEDYVAMIQIGSLKIPIQADQLVAAKLEYLGGEESETESDEEEAVEERVAQ